MLEARLARQVRVKELTEFLVTDQRFNVFVERTGPAGVLAEGDEVALRVEVGVESYLLLINIDPMDKKFSDLMDLINAYGSGGAQTTILVKTCAKEDIVRVETMINDLFRLYEFNNSH